MSWDLPEVAKHNEQQLREGAPVGDPEPLGSLLRRDNRGVIAGDLVVQPAGPGLLG